MEAAAVLPDSGRTAARCRSLGWALRGQQPDVAELHRVAVVLQQDRAGLARVAAQAGPRVGHDLVLALLVLAHQPRVVLDLDAVLVDGHAGRLGDLAVRALRGGELDVIALPDG